MKATIKIGRTEYGYFISIDLYEGQNYTGNISLHVDDCIIKKLKIKEKGGEKNE